MKIDYCVVAGSETPKYERRLFSGNNTFCNKLLAPRFQLRRLCQKPAPWCRSVCSRPTAVPFSVHPDNRRIFIWRDRGSRNNSAFVHESVRFGGGVVLVHEILRPIVVSYAAAIGDNFILMDDNSRPHRANIVEDSLFEEGIIRMEWPACSQT
ncbi:transposable element Tcb2 transposase [Trichonephila clavipes]|nr:transposable element Tcb2 transposase [Trichonephila clavipes]